MTKKNCENVTEVVLLKVDLCVFKRSDVENDLMTCV